MKSIHAANKSSANFAGVGIKKAAKTKKGSSAAFKNLLIKL